MLSKYDLGGCEIALEEGGIFLSNKQKDRLIHTELYWVRCNSGYEFFTHF